MATKVHSTLLPSILFPPQVSRPSPPAGFEPATTGLRDRRSTTELRRFVFFFGFFLFFWFFLFFGVFWCFFLFFWCFFCFLVFLFFGFCFLCNYTGKLGASGNAIL